MRINYFKSIFDIDYSLYPNVKVLVFDIDNTLASPKIRHPSDEVKKYIKDLQNKGYTIFLYSNNIFPRIVKFAISLDVKYFDPGHKPFAGEMKRYLRYSQHKPEEVLFIGDQIFTDMFCGAQCGVRLALVDPMTNHDEFWVKIRRPFEKPFRKKLARMGCTYNQKPKD